MKKKVIYVVLCTERGGEKVFDRADNFTYIGLFQKPSDAVKKINDCLLKKKEAIAQHYDNLLQEIQSEINGAIIELTTEKEPETHHLLKVAIEQMEEKMRYFESNKVPEMLVQNDENGMLREITAKDEYLGWICSFDIIPETIE